MKMALLRVPEPEVMDDQDQVGAYVASIRQLELIAPTHEVLMDRSAEVVPRNGSVLDLGCGSGDPIVQLLERRPDLQATAVDLSPQMLDAACDLAHERGVIDRIRFEQADITRLAAFATADFDAVTSTLCLHHLPCTELLRDCITQINRVLKPDGALFLADFARLPSEKWMNRFADRDAGIQSKLYRRDFYNSMRAAWSADELLQAFGSLKVRCDHFVTPVLPFLQIITTPKCAGVSAVAYSNLKSARAKRTAKQLSFWLRLAGLRKRSVGGVGSSTRQAA